VIAPPRGLPECYALKNLNCTAGGFHMKNSQGNWVSCTLPTTGCYHYQANVNEVPSITSNEMLQQIASPGDFYDQPNPGQLNTIFAAIATDIGSGTSRLVDDGF
jgi:hypothetical protein